LYRCTQRSGLFSYNSIVVTLAFQIPAGERSQTPSGAMKSGGSYAAGRALRGNAPSASVRRRPSGLLRGQPLTTLLPRQVRRPTQRANLLIRP
jgi:hypothetical protein